jgi:putative transposase
LHTFHKLFRSTLEWIAMMLALLSSLLKSRATLQLENIALRHQIGVLQRSTRKRLLLNNADRLLWIGLSRVWAEWRSGLRIVKPGTVIAWHRRAFRKFWTWKVRRGRPGRPAVSAEIRVLIRRMSRENPGWGA